VYYQQSVQLHNSLTSLGRVSQLVSFPGLAHGFDLTWYFPPHSFTAAGLVAKDSILTFLRRVLRLSTSVDAQESVSELFHLYQNYPNPFNPSTTISYQAPQGIHVTLRVIDVLGREVATLVDEKREPGTHQVEFDARNLATGMYFYRIQAAQFAETKRMILLR
jgi:hypothetical protein